MKPGVYASYVLAAGLLWSLGDALVLLNIQPAAALLLALAVGQRVAPAHTICFILMTLAMLLRSRASAVQLPT